MPTALDLICAEYFVLCQVFKVFDPGVLSSKAYQARLVELGLNSSRPTGKDA